MFCFLGPLRRARDVPSLFELVGSAGVGCVRGHIYRIGELYRPFVAARRVGAKIMTTLTHKVAQSMLADKGVGVIWKLHSDAATLARIGNYAAALSLSE